MPVRGSAAEYRTPRPGSCLSPLNSFRAISPPIRLAVLPGHTHIMAGRVLASRTWLMQIPIERFVKNCVRSLEDRTFVRVVLSGSTASGPGERIVGRAVEIKGETAISLTWRAAARN